MATRASSKQEELEEQLAKLVEPDGVAAAGAACWRAAAAPRAAGW